MATEPTEPQDDPGGESTALAPSTSTELALTDTEEWLSEQTGVEFKHTPMGLVWLLPPTLHERVHMLHPASQIVQVSPHFRPLPKLVQLVEGKHTYEEGNATKVGNKKQHALTAKGLALVAEAAAIQFLPPIKEYVTAGDRVVGVSYTARAIRRGPDGTMQEHAATKDVLFDRLEAKTRRERAKTIKGWDDQPSAERLEELLQKAVDDVMEHVSARTETKAMNRVIRHWLAVDAVYPAGTINRKPFLVVQWVFTPDHDDPSVRQIVDTNLGRGTRSLYEGVTPNTADARPALNAGSDPPDADVIEHDTIDEATIRRRLDAAPKPPSDAFDLTKGPYAGEPIDQVIETPDGKRWIAATVIDLKDPANRARLLAWLSYAEGREVTVEDCTALAQSPQTDSDDDIPF